MSVGSAPHRKSAEAERSSVTRGEAVRGEGSGEARSGRQAPADSGRGSLLTQALTRENWVAAWQRVRTNAGSAGVDGLSVGQTAEHLIVPPIPILQP